jgi:LmbE family N-acetylglucosaminyl deacetylase
MTMETGLPAVRCLVAVCAHPDDESFGLGAVLDAFVAAGTEVELLCFTRGEASTLGTEAHNLAAVRTAELMAAATMLGIADVTLLDYPDGGLRGVSSETLTATVSRVAGDADTLLVFDEGGIMVHPDHVQATAAACTAAQQSGLPVYAWTIPAAVGATLNDAFGTGFVGRETAALDICLHVDRTRQRTAIGCHRSQVTDNPVLWRRLALMNDRECLRVLAHRSDTRRSTHANAEGVRLHAYSAS